MNTAAVDPTADLTKELLAALKAHGITAIRLTHNRRLLLGLRGVRGRAVTLSIHHDLASQREHWNDLVRWVAAGGRELSRTLRAAMDEVFARQQRALPLPDLAPLGGPCDLPAIARHVHGTWFPHLAPVPVVWGRNAPAGRRRQIRFGSYRRRPAGITVHPLVDQPWVAYRFIEFILFHEYCHHAQACRPQPGETAHSARFRAWEARYPHRDVALAWERAALPRFLGTEAAP
jgi:hypothetical protein